ncbi:hypothetical protein GCM10009820_15070 [Leifsonia soli]
MPLWLIGLVIIAIILSFLMPWARRFDRRAGEKRVASGKPRSVVPIWLGVAICVVLIIAGIVLYNLP